MEIKRYSITAIPGGFRDYENETGEYVKYADLEVKIKEIIRRVEDNPVTIEMSKRMAM